MMRYVRLDTLLGKQVLDARGRKVGRIQSVSGKYDGPRCYVTTYDLGAGALLTRLGIVTARLIGLPLRRNPKRVPWQLMDLSDPSRPRLTVPLEELPQDASPV